MTSSTAQDGLPGLTFIGGGQMATALIAGLIRAGRPAASILVVEPNAAQREHLETTVGVRTAQRPDARLLDTGFVVWAVKPQVLRKVVAETRAYLGSALHVSIAAGLPLHALSAWLHSDRVVRAMPNTAALVGASVTGMVAAIGVSESDRELAAGLFAATGHCFWVESDEHLNAVTAVSGSGPAYVFHFLEAFQSAAEAVGFDPAQARDLVLRVTAGAVEQAKQGDSYGTLRARVTSKHGTTEAALTVLDERATPKALRDAVQAAQAKGRALAQELAGEKSL